MADPNYAAVAPAATVQVAASVIVTAILTPLLTSFVYKRVQRRRALEASTAPVAPPVPLVAAHGDD
jgi:2-keto-3-deoxygluconate permease